MKKNILILKQICKCIQKKTVLNQFYMNIQNGEIVNLIGMEDSGKEDVFSILFGQEKIDSGEIVFNRRSYTQMSQRIVEHAGGIFFINNDEPMVAELSVAENLYIVEKMNYFKRSVSRKRWRHRRSLSLPNSVSTLRQGKSGRTECIRTAYPESTAGICQAGKADCDQ